jgi:hypothetical protein
LGRWVSLKMESWVSVLMVILAEGRDQAISFRFLQNRCQSLVPLLALPLAQDVDGCLERRQSRRVV